MDQAVPWMFCFGIFVVMPILSFVAGLYIGRRGLPFEISKRANGGGESKEYG